jgi:sugar phosphate isomerase/epimerase
VYKILNSGGLGVAGKQNELIELALTHGFKGVEVDIVDLVGRHDTLGKQFACQFLQSAKIDMGTFELPVDLGGSDETYAASIANLDTVLDLATTLNAKGCYISIASSNGLFSFQECFEKHQQRLQELSEKFSSTTIKLGLSLRATDGEAGDGEFKFITTAEELLTLVKAVDLPNVGISLDTWQWVLGGGTVEQLTSAGIANVVTGIRLSDVSESADRAAITENDRTALPGDTLNSFSVQLCKAVIAEGAEVPVSVATNLATFSTGPRDSIVSQISKQLDLLIAGEDPAELKAAEVKAAEDAAAESDADSEDKDAVVATPADPAPAAPAAPATT